ncbi:MAG: hypothetical protein Q9184_002347 [Pyrenodesmia sp. 2 TL-2023]
MAPAAFHTSLLRPPILHILRAAGFHATKPEVLDTLVDLATRYLSMLAFKAAAHAQENHNDLTPDVTDVRMALEDVGALQPQIPAMEESITGKEDMRGVGAFIKWMKGKENREIRRIAGLFDTEGLLPGLDVPTEKEDFLTSLKKKHNKTGESSRFQGTVLGSSTEEKVVRIEGGPCESLQDWTATLQRQHRAHSSSLSRQPTPSPQQVHERDYDNDQLAVTARIHSALMDARHPAFLLIWPRSFLMAVLNPHLRAMFPKDCYVSPAIL